MSLFLIYILDSCLSECVDCTGGTLDAVDASVDNIEIECTECSAGYFVATRDLCYGMLIKYNMIITMFVIINYSNSYFGSKYVQHKSRMHVYNIGFPLKP